MRSFWLVLLVFLASPALVSAQKSATDAKPVGRFLEDSMHIADTVHFALSYRHNRALEVLFPDTSIRLQNFEVLAKRFFPTKTTGDISLDSTIYVLRSFDLLPVYQLSMPVYLLQNGDSIQIQSVTDSIGLIELVKKVSDPLQLAENVSPVALPQQFNYPFLIIGIVVSLLLLTGLFYLFGKPIRRLYERYMAQTSFKAFHSRFESLIRKFKRGQTVQVLEEAVTLWKNYLTALEDKPINSFTTKEIAEFYNEEELSEVLKLCDKAIYGGIIENEQNQTTNALSLLKDFSVLRYNQLQNKPSDVERIAS